MERGSMIFNKTKNKVISSQERVCTSLWSQARGLMFRPKQNLIMIFPKEKEISLHMFFVFYPIDVLILDSTNKIVEIKRNFKPFTFWKSTMKGKSVVELGIRGEYAVGDKLGFR